MSADESNDGGQTASGGAETELKFDVTREGLRRLAKHPVLTGVADTEPFNATYFDTPAFTLRKAGVSLRVRKEGPRHVQTVKRMRGADLFARDEWETEVPSAQIDEDALSATPVAKLLHKDYASLAPIFTSDVKRATRAWADGDAAISVTIDSGKLSARGAHAPVLEMELELKAGQPQALYDLARQLFDIAPIRLSLLSKSDRGFALAGEGAARAGKASATPLAPEMSIREAFRRIARSCLVQIIAASEILQHAPTAEGVHQTRIGLRRLRTAMKIFKPAVDDARVDWIDQEVRWIAAELGDARALDVFQEDAYLPNVSALSDQQAAARYGVQLEGARRAAYEKATTAVASPRFARLTLEIAIWVASGDWLAAEEREALLASPIGPFAADTLDQLRKRVRKRGEGLANLPADQRHKLRIRAKRLRYATQFFERAFGVGDEKRRQRFTNALKALQTSLGRLNDIATAEATATQGLNGNRTPALSFTAGQIVGRIKVAEPVEIDRAIEAFEDFTGAKRFWPRKKAADEAIPDEDLSSSS